MVDKLVSVSELSRQTGKTKQSISMAKSRGKIIPDSYTDSGRPLFYLEKTKKILMEQSALNEEQARHEGLTKALQGGRPKSSQRKNCEQNNNVIELKPLTKISNNQEVNADEDINKQSEQSRILKAKAERAEILAELGKIELEKARGDLVYVLEVEKQGAELGTVLINALTTIPDRLAPELSTISDQHEIHRMLTDEINLVISIVREDLHIQ